MKPLPSLVAFVDRAVEGRLCSGLCLRETMDIIYVQPLIDGDKDVHRWPIVDEIIERRIKVEKARRRDATPGQGKEAS
jgi:hypothetical protein